MLRFLLKQPSLFVILASCCSPAYAAPDVKNVVSLMTESEVALSTIAIISEHIKKPIEGCAWSVEFFDRQWRATVKGGVNGNSFNFSLDGYIWGEDSENLLVQFSGSGDVLGERLKVVGTAEWIFNKEASDYRAMNFRQVAEIGTHSDWGWVLGSEIIVGAIAGGGAAAAAGAAATAGTGGVAAGLMPWIIAGGAVSGAAALSSISSTAHSLLSTDKAPPPPTKPEPPQMPGRSGSFPPEPEQTIITMLGTSKLAGSAFDGVHLMTGNYSTEKGYASGDIFSRKR